MSATIEILSAVHGIAPRSEELLRLGIDYGKGRVDRTVVDELLAQERSAWLSLQADVGIDVVGDGQLRWQDHLRPIVKATTAGFEPHIDTAPVTRWFADNRFYRRPILLGKTAFDGVTFNDVVGEPGETVSLIGPKTFAACIDTQLEPAAVSRTLQDLYEQLLRFFSNVGVKQIVQEDYVPDTNALTELASDTGIEVHRVPIHAFEQRPSQLTRFWSHARQLGIVTSVITVVDANSTAPDVPQDFRDWPTEAASTAQRILLTHAADLEKLPLPIAQDKVKRLGEYAARAKEYIGATI